MKRLRTILLFLLLGAIVNVVVAWGIALLAPHPSSFYRKGFTPGGEQYGAWNTDRFVSIGIECIHSNWKLPIFPNGPYYPPPKQSADSILPAWAIYAYPDEVPIVMTCRYLEATGWPMLTFWSGRESLGLMEQDWPAITPEGFIRTEVPAPRFYLGILMPDQPAPSLRTLHGLTVLPYGPLWPGLVINTLFYAGILWLLIPGPYVLRRMIRHKRGLCVKCAYDLRGVDHEACPECGEAIRKANPA